MVKPKKNLNICRPYNNGKLSESELRTKIINKLRQFTQYWNPAKAVKAKAKKCAICWITKWPFDADHIESVVPINWWNDTSNLFLGYNWTEYLQRALVEEDGYQALCKPCHKFRTKKDNEDRRNYKKLN